MRRVAAAIAVSAYVVSTGLPAFASLCCASLPSHPCCAKAEENRPTALERAPCCKLAAVTKPAPREQVLPGTSGSTVPPAVASISNHPAILMADNCMPSRQQIRASPPLGPPLRLRI